MAEDSQFRYSQKALDEDAYAEADPITQYPTGISLMGVSAGANWGSATGEAGLVTTKSDGTNGVQTFEAYNGNSYNRAYTSGSWSAWAEAGGGGGGSSAPLADNAHAEAALPTAYPAGVSTMRITEGDAWVANAGISEPDAEEPYYVTTSMWSDGGGWQLLYYWSSDQLYMRSSHLEGDAWYAWARISQISAAHSPISSDTAFSSFASTGALAALDARVDALENP
jgi:hypothetical protein